MSNYPRAWGLFHNPQKQWADPLCASRLSAEDCACNGDSIVELISLPEHESIVAAAVAAERERLTSIIRSINPCDIEDSRPTFAGATLRYVLNKIREVPE